MKKNHDEEYHEETKRGCAFVTHPHPIALWSLFRERLQQPLAGILQESDDQFKVAIVTIVWVWNGSILAMMCQEISHANHLVLIRLTGSHGSDGTIIVVVHHHDGIEAVEV